MTYTARNPNGQATMANSEPVVLASDQSAVPVSDNGGSLTVDGTVAVTGVSTAANQTTIIGHLDGVEGLLTTIDADTSNISTKIDTLAGAVSGTEMQVDVLTMPTVTVADGGGSLTVDGTVAVSGTVAVTQSGTRDEVGINDSGNSITVDDGGLSLTVDGTVAATQSGTWTLGANSGVDIGDVTINNASGASAVNIQDGGNSITVDGTITASNTAGDVAHDTADSGNPVKMGFKAYELDGTEPGTAVAEGDRANGISDKYGRQYVVTAHPRFFHVSADYASAQTNATVRAAPGAGVALYITDIMISNGATAGNITLLDGSGGTVLFEIYPAINGGATMNLSNPIKLTDNTALVITSTTVTTHSVFISGFIE